MFKKLFKLLFPQSKDVHYTTVRYAFPVVVLAAIFASFASVISENASFITVRTNAENVAPNETFFIDVLATTHVPVNAVDIAISYPQNKMIVDGIDTGTSVITLWAEKPYAKDGVIYLRGGTFRKGFMGEHTIARVKAHATEAGEARILIKDSQLVAGDGKGTSIATHDIAEYSEVKINVGGAEGVIKARADVSVVTDTNGDGDVDLGDIASFMTAWFSKKSLYDFNGDGYMTFKDFSILLADSFFN